MTRDDIIRMAREAGFAHSWSDAAGEALERFASMVAEAERQASSVRRGTIMFNPYTGTPRHPADIASDPHGILLLDPEQTPLTSAIRARGQS